jgi:hypothetical protein
MTFKSPIEVDVEAALRETPSRRPLALPPPPVSPLTPPATLATDDPLEMSPLSLSTQRPSQTTPAPSQTTPTAGEAVTSQIPSPTSQSMALVKYNAPQAVIKTAIEAATSHMQLHASTTPGPVDDGK